MLLDSLSFRHYERKRPGPNSEFSHRKKPEPWLWGNVLQSPYPHHGVRTEENPPAGPSRCLQVWQTVHRMLEMEEGRAMRGVQGWPCARVAEYFPGWKELCAALPSSPQKAPGSLGSEPGRQGKLYFFSPKGWCTSCGFGSFSHHTHAWLNQFSQQLLSLAIFHLWNLWPREMTTLIHYHTARWVSRGIFAPGSLALEQLSAKWLIVI